MNNGPGIQSAPHINIYRKEFLTLSCLIFMTTILAKIYKLGNPGYWRLIGYLFHSIPFLILSYMTARWAIQKHDFTRQQFICRVSGVTLVYLVYLYMVRDLVRIAEIPDMPIGWLVYPISMPFLIPLLYWTGYGIANMIYMRKPQEK
jgi:hypothetical protein